MRAESTSRPAAPPPRVSTSLSVALPATRDEMLARGWTELDVLIVTGDAYVDHPAFGAAMIARVLEAEGCGSASSRSRTGARPDPCRAWAGRACSAA